MDPHISTIMEDKRKLKTKIVILICPKGGVREDVLEELLDLILNDITEAGAKRLGETLPRTALQVVDMQRIPLNSNDAAKALANGFEGTTDLAEAGLQKDETGIWLILTGSCECFLFAAGCVLLMSGD